MFLKKKKLSPRNGNFHALDLLENLGTHVMKLVYEILFVNSTGVVHVSRFTKFGLLVLVKKMAVLINFLLQNANLVSVLSKICPKFAGHV
jgi:hypothetical protein